MTRERALQLMTAVDMGLVVTEQGGSDGTTFIDKIGEEDVTDELDQLSVFDLIGYSAGRWVTVWDNIATIQANGYFTQSENEHVYRK